MMSRGPKNPSSPHEASTTTTTTTTTKKLKNYKLIIDDVKGGAAHDTFAAKAPLFLHVHMSIASPSLFYISLPLLSLALISYHHRNQHWTGYLYTKQPPNSKSPQSNPL